MVGLPGCGKSTAVRTLRDQHRNRNNNHDGSVVIPLFGEIIIIDYDAIAKQELCERDGGNDDVNEDANLDPECKSLFNSNELAAWRRGRVTASKILTDTLLTHFAGGGNASTLLVILDDNFHLRSMRRDIYRSCQDIVKIIPQAKIGFSVVYFTTPLEICLRRNNMRSGSDRVPRDVINRMASIIEPPDETKPAASFERFHVSIENAMDTFDANTFIDDIFACLLSSLESPILLKNELSEDQIAQLEHQRMLQREETLKCKIQRIDQLLRKLVGAVGRVDKDRSRDANMIRRSILEMIRQDNDTVDMGLDRIVQHFACSTLGIELISDWHHLNNPLVLSIKEACRGFEKETTRTISTGT